MNPNKITRNLLAL